MTSNKNLSKQRQAGKIIALVKIAFEGDASIVKARTLEIESHTMIPVLSTLAKVQADQRLQSLSQIPSICFKPNGTIDKRRQKRFTRLKSIDAYIIQSN